MLILADFLLRVLCLEGPSMTILDTFMVQFWRSMINKDLDQGRVESLVRWSCADPGDTLRSLRDLVEVLVRRSCEDPADIL